MRANTIIMVLLAAVFGVVAVVLANMWLANQRNAMAAPSEAPRETIVVAAVPLKFGDVLTSDKLREIAWPSGAIPAGAFKTAAELLADEKGNRQALQAIGANEPVLATRITGPGQRATLSAVLADGMKAVSIRVNDVLGVAGFVFPGDRVDVLLTRNVRQAEGGERAYVDVLLQSIKVLAVDQIADESKENPTVVKAVTLEVSTRDAQKLTLAAGAGQLSLALRQVASNEGESTDRITLADLTGETPEDVAARQAALEAERKRAEEQFNGIRQVVENLGERIDERVGNVEDQLNKLKQPAPEPEAHEVVKEVVRYIQPEPPVRASVGVYRGMDRQVYDVPRAR
ncbi:Flp pilus assembly protein CpaB [Mesorhizobium sp. L-8-3]|uniref:Flp pilus assembly protein CpaB n=1 Tax=Mesorhizobium sp. L-8-3 TaxID=2744522 RepID=UPI001925CB39|nr:Flp pilus assembly protein CpaB [Mesorhizobium sp. L-8-3]